MGKQNISEPTDYIKLGWTQKLHIHVSAYTLCQANPRPLHQLWRHTSPSPIFHGTPWMESELHNQTSKSQARKKSKSSDRKYDMYNKTWWINRKKFWRSNKIMKIKVQYVIRWKTKECCDSHRPERAWHGWHTRCHPFHGSDYRWPILEQACILLRNLRPLRFSYPLSWYRNTPKTIRVNYRTNAWEPWNWTT